MRLPGNAIVLATLLAAAPAAGFAQATPRKDAYLRQFLGKTAPPFLLKDMKGTPVKLSDYRGRVVLLNFWYSACGPCRMETPDLVVLYGQYKEKGLVVLGINTDALVMPDDRGEMLRQFIDTYKMPYPILLADHKMYDDYGRPTIAPITLLVDRQGTIARVFWGAMQGPVFEDAVRPYLEARPAATPRGGASSAP